MDDELRRKQKQYKRAMKHFEKRIAPEERKRRQQETKRRRGGEKRGPRRRDWESVDDDAIDAFERIRSSRQDDPPNVPSCNAVEETPSVFGPTRTGVVTRVHRDRVDVRLDGADLSVATIGAAGGPIVVGDEVDIVGDPGEERVARRRPRRTILERPDPGRPARSLAIAANVDVACIVVAAARPDPRPGFIDRVLIALDRAGIEAVVCVNKVDLAPDLRAIDRMLEPYERLDVDIWRVSAATGIGVEGLRGALSGRTCVFVGPSGVGKSSLSNVLDPRGARDVGDVRRGDGKGRHTTSTSDLRELGDGTRIIDTPGVRAFGLWNVTPAELRHDFPEFARLPPCRFRDCSHVHEPDCEVEAAARRGDLPEARLHAYRRILASLDEV